MKKKHGFGRSIGEGGCMTRNIEEVFTVMEETPAEGEGLLYCELCDEIFRSAGSIVCKKCEKVIA